MVDLSSVATFAGDLNGWGVILIGVGTLMSSTGAVLTMLTRGTVREARNHARTAIEVAGKAVDGVQEVKLDQARIMTALSNHLEQTGRAIEQGAVAVEAMRTNQAAILQIMAQRIGGDE